MLDYASLNEGRASEFGAASAIARQVIAKAKEIRGEYEIEVTVERPSDEKKEEFTGGRYKSS